MKGAFIVNKYYKSQAIDYIFGRMNDCFIKRGHSLEMIDCPLIILDDKADFSLRSDYDFAVFWDKDTLVSSALENKGLRLFNKTAAIINCDSKAYTYFKLSGHDITVAPTIFAPLVYDSCIQSDKDLLEKAEKTLGFPMIVKQDYGSQGRQVYLAENMDELRELNFSLLYKPHIFQKFCSDEPGTDIRFYVIGGKVCACCKRTNTTSFKSNTFAGGSVSAFEPDNKTVGSAEKIADILELEYGSVDFTFFNGQFVFIEANSNAFFKGIESLKIDIAGKYVDYIIKTVG